MTVVGWQASRNQAATDTWVLLDKFVVDGRDYDDAGLPYTFSVKADGKLQLWVNREPLLKEEAAQPEHTDTSSHDVKLIRQQTPIQLNYSGGKEGGVVVLEWSNPFQSKQPIPTRFLYPVAPGRYTMENLRYVSDLPNNSNAKAAK